MKMRLPISCFAFIAVSCFCLISNGQQPWEIENRTPRPDDLIAYVEVEDGKPVSGVAAKVEIERTVGFFSGAGTPPIASRTPSNNEGKLRFSNGSNWRDWIQAEVAAGNQNNREPRDVSKDIAEFKAYRWTVSGYWPRTNSRIEFSSSGRPKLWHDEKPIKLILPFLHSTRIRIMSVADGSPLANVRLWITQRHRAKTADEEWDNVGAFAWTDATGSALVWLPNGSYDIRWDTTLTARGANAGSDLFDIRTAEFGELKSPLPPRNAMGDQTRLEVFERRSFYWNDTQPPLFVSDSPPDVYEIAIEPPLVIVP